MPLRGWCLLNGAEAVNAVWGTGCASSLAIACLAQTLLFAALHLTSPGVDMIGLTNLCLGGGVAALNAALTGSLAYTMGWHLAWNFTMGNIVGLSTSGIPISATVLSFAPDPRKPRMHGGTFGPEQGVLSPLAYLLSAVMVCTLYGAERYPEGITQGFPSLMSSAN